VLNGQEYIGTEYMYNALHNCGHIPLHPAELQSYLKITHQPQPNSLVMQRIRAPHLQKPQSLDAAESLSAKQNPETRSS
jgi:hypothetical protein